MRKLLIFTLLCSFAHAYEFAWFGTNTVVLKDKNKTYMFDPFITHPTPWEFTVGTNRKLR
jgi:L-ascorbate metabolism protein UlaG (beta-lactamase superfamily)